MILTKANQVRSNKPKKKHKQTKKKRIPTPRPEGEYKCRCGCGSTKYLSIHHVFNKSARDFSSKHGCVVWLCWNSHQSSTGIHGTHSDGKLNKALRQEFQYKLESCGMSREEFIYNVGKNYL